MTKKLFSFIILLIIIQLSFGQHIALTFKDDEEQGISIQHLANVNESVIHDDTNQAITLKQLNEMIQNVISWPALVSVISLILSIIAISFTKKTRDNDKRPLLEYSDVFGGNVPNSYIKLYLINAGSQATIIKIGDTIGNEIICPQINTSINKNSKLEITINPNKKIKHEDINYNINIYLKNIDNKIYMQTLIGNNIFQPKISLKKISNVRYNFINR